jgi:hypothetical protein
LRGVGKNLFIVISSLCYKSKGKNFTDVIWGECRINATSVEIEGTNEWMNEWKRHVEWIFAENFSQKNKYDENPFGNC